MKFQISFGPINFLYIQDLQSKDLEDLFEQITAEKERRHLARHRIGAATACDKCMTKDCTCPCVTCNQVEQIQEPSIRQAIWRAQLPR